MTDKNSDNFIVKFDENECSIKIELFHISNYFNHLKIMGDILLLVKLFVKSMDVFIKYDDKEYIINDSNELIEFLYNFIELTIPKLRKNKTRFS